jgi:Flp pilus assembly protein TadD
MDGERWVKKAYDAILAGDFGRAVACFDRAVGTDPENASFHYKLSVTCARSGRLDKALQAANKAVELEPDNEIYIQHVHHVKAKELLAMAAQYMEGPEWDPEYGNGDKRDENRRKAAELLQRAVILDPLSAETFLLLGAVMGEAGEEASALLSVKEALRLDPNQPDGERLLAELTRKLADNQTISDKRGTKDHGQICH